MKSKYYSEKAQALNLRKSGKTYSEIKKIINKKIPKSTLSFWCKEIELTKNQKARIEKLNRINAGNNIKKAITVIKTKRQKFLQSVFKSNRNLKFLQKNKDVAKIALSILYLGEGTKNIKRGSLCFGNSDPFVIDLFLCLMRKCYNINESKFRCTVQCRADQNTRRLENFWGKITKIPLSQFYKARIDPRTVGKKSKNPEYKGVCRIDYYSADIFLELLYIPKIIHKMGP